MNIDFHYGVIYVTSRLAGMSQEQAQIVAHSCQYVDDATTPGILEFSGGETFDRFASAHKLFDYRNVLNQGIVWKKNLSVYQIAKSLKLRQDEQSMGEMPTTAYTVWELLSKWHRFGDKRS